MSSGFVGSSSESVSGASSSGVSGGSSALTQSILSSVALAAENVPLGSSPSALAAPASATPPTSPTPVLQTAPSSLTTWLVVIVVIVLGVFAYRKL
jgi:hypothetical protein